MPRSSTSSPASASSPSPRPRPRGGIQVRPLRHPQRHVKKTALRDFSNVMSRGIIAINIDKDDELIIARITDGEQIIFLATHDGMPSASTSRTSAHGPSRHGNRGINLRKETTSSARLSPLQRSPQPPALELAAQSGLTRQAKSVINEVIRVPHPSRPYREGWEAIPRRPGSPRLRHPNLPEAAAKLAASTKTRPHPCLILTVSENGFGKRTGVDAYRLQSAEARASSP